MGERVVTATLFSFTNRVSPKKFRFWENIKKFFSKNCNNFQKGVAINVAIIYNVSELEKVRLPKEKCI